MDILEKLTTLVRKAEQKENDPKAVVYIKMYGDGSGSIMLWAPWALSEDGMTHALYSWDSLEHLAIKLDMWLEYSL